MVEIDRKKYGCDATDEDGEPRGCRRLVVAKKNRGVTETVYPYVRLAPGDTREGGLHEEGRCSRAEELESKEWGSKPITRYTRL
jgi:hypothetical protein